MDRDASHLKWYLGCPLLDFKIGAFLWVFVQKTRSSSFEEGAESGR
jgi:hypothetical protein